MKALRVAMVTRRYWPLASGSATVMAHLAEGLRDEGIECTIVTPRWGSAWPAQIVHRAARVVRLPISPYRTWRNLRYGWTLSAWLRRHAARFDLVYVSELKHEAAAAVVAAERCGWPVVLRAENTGLTGDKGLSDLLVAWSLLAAERPHARLWLIGDGPERDDLAGQLDSLGLGGTVAMPGVFDDVEDVLRAADVFVYPTLEAGTAVAP